MNGRSKVDVLVIGLGPAGASAAAEAAKAGARVAAIERKKCAGVPVQCAEFVPGPLAADVPGFARAARQAITAMVTLAAEDSAQETPDYRGQMIDRAVFDQGLVEAAKAAGAGMCLGTAATSLDADGVRLANGGTIRAAVIIGADGPHSLAGKVIGAVNREIVETRQITVPLLRAHQATDIFLSLDYRGGYGWLFPKGSLAHIGLGVSPERRQALKELLAALHQRLVAEGRVGHEVRGLTGGAIPVGGLLPAASKLGETHVLLAGDAAGLTNPVTGAGIASAVQSGRMVGQAAAAICKGNALAAATYTQDLEDLFGPSLARALHRRNELLQKSAPTAADLKCGWIASPDYWLPYERPSP